MMRKQYLRLSNFTYDPRARMLSKLEEIQSKVDNLSKAVKTLQNEAVGLKSQLNESKKIIAEYNKNK